MVIADFRADFPEFSDTAAYPDAQITFWATVAEQQVVKNRWGNLYTQGVMLYVAHEITLASQNKSVADSGGMPGQNEGIANSKTVGNVSASYDSGSNSEASAGFWNLTNYGKQFIHLARLFGAGCIQLPNSCTPGAGFVGWWNG